MRQISKSKLGILFVLGVPTLIEMQSNPFSQLGVYKCASVPPHDEVHLMEFPDVPIDASPASLSVYRFLLQYTVFLYR